MRPEASIKTYGAKLATSADIRDWAHERGQWPMIPASLQLGRLVRETTPKQPGYGTGLQGAGVRPTPAKTNS